MRIIDIQVRPLSYLTNDKPPRLRSFALLRLETDSGLVGWGEASDCYGHRHPLAVKALVDEHLRWLFLDENPIDIAKLIRKAWQKLYRSLGARELIVQAMSGIEIALWDIYGKEKGMAISDLLGSHYEKVPIYAAGKIALFNDPSEHLELFQSLLERGVGAVKIRVGRNIEWDTQMVRDIRNGLPSKVQLFVDGKYNYFPESAVQFSRILAEADVSFFEEPIIDLDLDVLRDVNVRSAVPLAYGEHSFGIHGFRDLLLKAGLSVVEPDVSICGGIAEAVKISHLAQAFSARIFPHCGGLSAIGLAANLHFSASLPEPTMLEFDARPWQPLRDDLASGAPFRVEAVKEGMLDVPDAPGLGVEIDEKVLEEFPYDVNTKLQNKEDIVYGTPHI